MGYYRYLFDYIVGAKLEVGKIYPSEFYPTNEEGVEGAIHIEVYVENCRHFRNPYWEEVSEQDYLTQMNE